MTSNKCYDRYGLPVTHMTQWDTNATLMIYNYKCDAAPIIHFSTDKSETSKTVWATIEDGVVSMVVPNILLLEPGVLDICVFQYDVESDDGHVVRRYKLPILAKPKPDDYEYVENTEIIELSTLGARLEALVAEADGAVNVRIGELEAAYNSTVQGIKDDIATDVSNLNQSIRVNRTKLELDISTALRTMLESVSDGSPRGMYTNVAELADKPSGIYLYVNPSSDDDGYAFWWDGTSTTKLVYYAGKIINDETITYEMLSEALRKNVCETVISKELLAESWSNLSQEIDVSDDYEITSHTKANIDIGSATYEQLVQDGCGGIYLQTNNNTLIAHALWNPPTEDVTIQITLKEVK